MAMEVIHVSAAEFANDVAGYLERVMRDGERVVVENGAGLAAEVRPARPRVPRGHPDWTPTAEELAAMRSATFSWTDEEAEDFLRQNRESRDLPPRPRVEL